MTLLAPMIVGDMKAVGRHNSPNWLKVKCCRSGAMARSSGYHLAILPFLAATTSSLVDFPFHRNGEGGASMRAAYCQCAYLAPVSGGHAIVLYVS